MRGHLTDRDMMEDADSLAEAVRAHLARCLACRREYRRLWGALAEAAAVAFARAERPEAFWRRQRARIARRSGASRGRRATWRRAWAPALVAAGLLVVLWTRDGQPPARTANADHELLAAVQRSIARDVPPALLPAALLIAEIEDGTTVAGHSHSARQGGPR